MGVQLVWGGGAGGGGKTTPLILNATVPYGANESIVFSDGVFQSWFPSVELRGVEVVVGGGQCAFVSS